MASENKELDNFLALAKREGSVRLYFTGVAKIWKQPIKFTCSQKPAYTKQNDALAFCNDHYKETGEVLSFGMQDVTYESLLGLVKINGLLTSYTPKKDLPVREGEPYPDLSLSACVPFGNSLFVPVSLLKFVVQTTNESGDVTEHKVTPILIPACQHSQEQRPPQ